MYCLPIWFVSFLNVFSSLHAGEWEYFRTGAKVLCKLINLVYKGGAAFSLVIEMYTPNANMADLSGGPGLVPWKRG